MKGIDIFIRIVRIVCSLISVGKVGVNGVFGNKLFDIIHTVLMYV